MRAFSKEIVQRLQAFCEGEPIHWIGLGRNDFQFAFDRVERVSCFNRVRFAIGGAVFVWSEGPIRAPVWLLVGQVPRSFVLVDDLTMRMIFSSGDSVDIFTDISPYEAVLIELHGMADDRLMEVF